MVKCSVHGCKNYSGVNIPDVSFHSFPESDELRQSWIAATGRTGWTPTPSSKVCSRHFDKKFLFKKKKLTLLLHNAVPTRGLPRAPRTKLAVPSVCVSIGDERFLQIPNLVPETLTPIIVKTESITDDQQLESSNHENDRLSENCSVDIRDTKTDSEQFIISIDPAIPTSYHPSPVLDHDYALKSVPEETEIKDENIESFYSDGESSDTLSADLNPEHIDDDTNHLMLLQCKNNKLELQCAKQKTQIEELQKELKITKQKMLKAEAIVEKNKAIWAALKACARHSEIDNVLQGRYQTMCKFFTKIKPRKPQFSTEVFQFAVSLYYLSPKAYGLLNKHMLMPNVNIVKKYLAKHKNSVTVIDT